MQRAEDWFRRATKIDPKTNRGFIYARASRASQYGTVEVAVKCVYKTTLLCKQTGGLVVEAARSTGSYAEITGEGRLDAPSSSFLRRTQSGRLSSAQFRRLSESDRYRPEPRTCR